MAGVDIAAMGDPAPVDITAPPMIIGLCGDAGAGKSTVAAILARLGYTRLAFARPLKRMLQTLLQEAGVPAADLARYTDGDLKEAPCDHLMGCTPRHAMQALGTEWGRDMIHGNLWSALTASAAARLWDEGCPVVVEDVRFANEAQVLRAISADAEIWRITGRGGIPGGHASEGQPIPADQVIDNSGDLDALDADILWRITG